MTVENIVLLVWDACRSDHIDDHAPALAELGAQNLRFDRAVAPATWSLPSHASLFSGCPPHEHGITSDPQSFDTATSLQRLGDLGYTRYGVSANGFTARNPVADIIFDEFEYTLNRMRPGALNASSIARQPPTPSGATAVAARFASILAGALTHERPVSSLRNVAQLLYNRGLFGRLDRFADLHPLFAPTQLFQYTPEWNTDHIEWFLSQHDPDDGPFYLFSNYMDTHHPYYPAPSYQHEVLGESLPYREIKRINDAFGNPVDFIQHVERGTVDEDDLDTLRGLYTAEVRAVDDQLSVLLDRLERLGIREETLIIVTADHGENLGETDAYGRRRMGHIDSMSDALLQVPLVVAHPELEGDPVTEWASLTGLCDLFEAVAAGESPTAERIKSALVPEDGVVVVERPADHSGERWTGYPDLPAGASERESFRHTAAGYSGEWKYVADSAGEATAWYEGDERATAAAPEPLRAAVDDSVGALCEMDPLGGDRSVMTDLDADVRSELESLGYL